MSRQSPSRVSSISSVSSHSIIFSRTSLDSPQTMQATAVPDFDALKRTFEAGVASTNGSGGAIYAGAPFVPQQQHPMATNGTLPTNGASTSPFLSGANSPNNGAPLPGFGSPSSVPGGLPLPAGNGMGHGKLPLPVFAGDHLDSVLKRVYLRSRFPQAHRIPMVRTDSTVSLPCRLTWA